MECPGCLLCIMMCITIATVAVLSDQLEELSSHIVPCMGKHFPIVNDSIAADHMRHASIVLQLLYCSYSLRLIIAMDGMSY